MKRLFTAVLIAGVGLSPVYAGLKTITADTKMIHNNIVTWKLTSSNMVGYINVTGSTMKTRFFVNEYLTDSIKSHEGHVLADKVMFSCNDVKTILPPDTWVECDIKDNNSAYVTIDEENFKNGADGFIENVF